MNNKDVHSEKGKIKKNNELESVIKKSGKKSDNEIRKQPEKKERKRKKDNFLSNVKINRGGFILLIQGLY